MRRPLMTLLALFALTTAPVVPQDVVPGVSTELVQLDVVVTDKQGALVRDLSREDFEVLEDGKHQPLSHFVLTAQPAGKGAAPLPGAAAVPAPTPAQEPPAAVGEGRRIIVVVDDLHITAANLEYTKQALARLVDEVIQPGDKVAVVTTSTEKVLQQWTDDRAVVKQAVGQLRGKEAEVAPARGSQMTPVMAEMVLGGDMGALQLGARMIMTEPGSTLDGGASPQAAVEQPLSATAGIAAGIDANKQSAAEKELKRQARGILNEALRYSVASLATIDGVLRGMASLPGRKLCLVLSDGFLVGKGTSEERTRDLQTVIDAATRSGTVVYTLDTRGLVSGGGNASPARTVDTPGLQSRVDRGSQQLFRDTLDWLARDTGGFLVRGSNDLAAGLRRMVQDNDAYYVMAYEPRNTKRDGRFRKLEVRLPQHRDYTVRTRRGYFAPDDKKKAPAPATAASLPASAGPKVSTLPPRDEVSSRKALEMAVPENGIPVRLTVDFLDVPPKGSQAVVHAQVDVARLSWRDSAGRRQAAVDFVGGVYDASGALVGAPFGRRAELDVSPAEYKRLAESGVRYHETVPLPTGRYQVKLLALDPSSSLVGSATSSLEIPDLADKKLAISSVFLSSSAAPAGQVAGSSGDMRDAQTLRRFKSGDTAYFQLYVYNPLADEKGNTDVVLQAQLWSGGKAVAASKPQPAARASQQGSGPVPETNEMSLKGLPSGAYALRVVVVDQKAKTQAMRQVDFTLE